jgi:hypothetical protein
MITCTRCKKRPAVVFVTRVENGQTANEGYCLSCAKELGIQPVNDMLKKFGISDDDVEQMNEQMEEMMALSEGEDEEEDGFSPGGAPAFPFLQNLFPGMKADGATEKPTEQGKGDKAVFYTAMKLFTVIGLVGALLMMVVAPFLAKAQGSEAVLWGYYTLAPSVLLVSAISVFRGWFQG